jgi:hypothetical protein
MGMFDSFKVHPNWTPGKIQPPLGEEFQTKDLDCELLHFEINEAGKIECSGTGEIRCSQTSDELSRFQGMLEVYAYNKELGLHWTYYYLVNAGRIEKILAYRINRKDEVLDSMETDQFEDREDSLEGFENIGTYKGPIHLAQACFRKDSPNFSLSRDSSIELYDAINAKLIDFVAGCKGDVPKAVSVQVSLVPISFPKINIVIGPGPELIQVDFMSDGPMTPSPECKISSIDITRID